MASRVSMARNTKQINGYTSDVDKRDASQFLQVEGGKKKRRRKRKVIL